MAKKFFAVEVTPAIGRVAYDNNDVVGAFTVLPLPVRAGEACLLRSMAIQDRNHMGVDLDIVFVKNKTGDVHLGTSGGAVDITDANLTTNVLLGSIHIAGDEDIQTGSQYTHYSDLITNEAVTITGIDLMLGSSTITPSGAGTAEAQTGCYFGLIARAAYDTSGLDADGLTFVFGFVVL